MSWSGMLSRAAREVVALPARWWGRWGRRKAKLYRYVYVEEFPDSLEARKLYLAGGEWLFLGRCYVVPVRLRRRNTTESPEESATMLDSPGASRRVSQHKAVGMAP